VNSERRGTTYRAIHRDIYRATYRATGRAAQRKARVAAMIAAAALVLTACGTSTPTNVPANTTYTAVPIAQTPWPSGTVGQYGLRIDPSLLARLPSSVDALPLTEDAASESGDLANADLANNFDTYAAAAIGFVGDPDWLNVALGTLKPSAQTADFYTSWVADYATGACSQADGVASNSEQNIGDWIVDVSTCSGGPVVYTLKLDGSTLLSMYGLGPKDLGRKLIGLLQ
jgi:hypothetical protein